MRTPEEIVAQVDALLPISSTSSEAEDIVQALRWVLGEEPTPPSEYWKDYLK